VNKRGHSSESVNNFILNFFINVKIQNKPFSPEHGSEQDNEVQLTITDRPYSSALSGFQLNFNLMLNIHMISNYAYNCHGLQNKYFINYGCSWFMFVRTIFYAYCH